MSEVKLVVLYPYPADAARFDRDYAAHLQLLHSMMKIPPQARPYTVTRFVDLPSGRPAYYQMFSLPFPSAAALQQAMGSAENAGGGGRCGAHLVGWTTAGARRG